MVEQISTLSYHHIISFPHHSNFEVRGDTNLGKENPNPDKRPGQIHYQDNNGGKFIYDNKSKSFKGLSKKINDNLLANPSVQKAIVKGNKYLGIK